MPEIPMRGGYPYRGRPRRADLEEIRRANRQAEYEHFARQEALKEQFEHLVERMGRSGSGMPEEFAQMMKLLVGLGAGPFQPDSPPSMEAALPQFIRYRAREMPGIHIAGDYRGGSRADEVEIYDFTALTQGATRIRWFPKGDPETREEGDPCQAPYVEIWHGKQVSRLDGSVADAYLGYLHYQGIFLVEDAKRPCPDCADAPSGDCETCGGLQWIIPEPEPSFPVTGQDTPTGAAVPVATPQFAVDDPQVNQTIQTLLDSNLKALSVLQAIKRWCNSDPHTTSDDEVLHAIEGLVDQALLQPSPSPGSTSLPPRHAH